MILRLSSKEDRCMLIGIDGIIQPNEYQEFSFIKDVK